MTQTPFPARAEAEWRQAAEAALKGAPFDRLVSVTADGLTLSPLYEGKAGARALRGAPGPWKALSRLDHPSAADFNAQAHEDIDSGADGLSVVFAGSGAAYGFGLADCARLDAAFEGLRFDAGHRFRLEIGDVAQARAFAALVERSGADVPRADLGFGLDPLAETLEPAAGELRRRGFAGPLCAADGRAVHDAGGAPGQELAFALAAGLAALRRLEDPRQIEFRLAADADEIATLSKFRALRLLWARVEQACGLAPAPIRLSATSAWRMMCVAEPYVNVMRTTLAAFAAGLGGADDVTLLPFTQAIGLPDAFARRLARNAQLIQLREARLGAVADPAAGAGAFEALTEGMCAKAWAQFQAIEAAGGLAKALDQGLVQQGVAEAAAALKRDVARAKTPLTGVSAHPHLEAEPIAVLPDAPSLAPPGPLAPFRLSEPFERLRAEAERREARVYLVAIGPLSAHTQRIGFAREFFEAGGVRTMIGQDDAAGLAAAYQASGATMACLCGADEAYAERAEPLAILLKAAGALVYLAGRPGEREAAWRAAGVDGFIHAGMDRVAALEEALRRA